jgi:hypothetical protein
LGSNNAFGSLVGMIIIKVDPDEYEQMRKYLDIAIQRHWTSASDDDGGVVVQPPPPVLGVTPDQPYLGSPCLADVESACRCSPALITDIVTTMSG